MQACIYHKQKKQHKIKWIKKLLIQRKLNDSLQPVLTLEPGTQSGFVADKSNPLEAMGAYIRPDTATEEEDTQQGKVKKQTPPPSGSPDQ